MFDMAKMMMSHIAIYLRRFITGLLKIMLQQKKAFIVKYLRKHQNNTEEF